VKVSANRYHHEIELADPSELDQAQEVIGWVEEAYSLTT